MVEKAKEEKRRKILVTGSNGMLGVDLCRELSKKHDVLGFDLSEGKETIKCDITDRDTFLKLAKDTKPDLIIHTAAWTDVDGCEKDPDKAYKINRDGTENAALLSEELNVPLIYISTDFVFDGEKKSPYNETDSANPLNVYAKSKLEGEKKVESLEEYAVIRTGWLYGKNGKNFVDTILDLTKSKKTLKVVDDQVGAPTYTKDLAKAIVKLLEAGMKKGIYNVSNKGEASWFAYTKEILEISGINDVNVVPITSEELGRPAKRPSYSVLNNSKFEKLTHFTMRSWQEALREYLSEK